MTMGQGILIRKTTEEVVYQIKTLEEAHRLSVHISNETPHPNRNLIISELMYNAIEHGNLGISFEEKSLLIEQDIFLEEVQRRLQLPEHMHKHATVTVVQKPESILVSIADMGNGFNYTRFLKIDESRLTGNNGRGIAIANSILQMQYNDIGNLVKVLLPIT
jgi:hypothetical protein